MTKAGHMIAIEVIIRTIRILEVGTMLEMIGIGINIIEVIEIFKDRDTSCDRCRSRDRENRGEFGRNRRDNCSRNRDI